MKNKNEVTYLKDYQAVPYKIESVRLHFDIHEHYCQVENVMKIELIKNVESIVLHGAEDVKLIEVEMDNEKVSSVDYSRKHEDLKISVHKKSFLLKITTQIDPKKNFSLNGLYFSGGSYFTQNEPHGFRHITFYGDRPDVLSVFTTQITANTNYKYLLSNGNLIESGILPNDPSRHYAIWQDPFPKPCYLFALVVGNFDLVEGSFNTQSGRKVQLQIFIDPGMTHQATHALESLKRSLQWDEEKYGLEYDLDTYMIVAAHSFNMGAMENKGLNIFNSKYILGDYKTATDEDLENIEAVVAHEYFHNWTGNRVTCRDWFQLTLKEGLTVFRDQQFTADQHGEVVKRIKDVTLLRNRQFEEDAGPLSHPIRPSSYVEMNNFYTATVYEKGAEVVRMIHTIVGEAIFKKSLRFYLENFDGQAATVEDFISSFERVSGRSLKSFMTWYSTQGTPTVSVKEKRISDNHIQVTFEQFIENNPDASCVDIPLKIAWILPEHKLKFQMKLLQNQNSEAIDLNENEVLFILRDKKVEASFLFEEKKQQQVFSCNRHFSAPIKLLKDFKLNDYQILAEHDDDDFNKWDACQTVIRHYYLDAVKNKQSHFSSDIIQIVGRFFNKPLSSPSSQNYFNALFLSPPSEYEINELLEVYNFKLIRSLYLSLKQGMAYHLKDLLLDKFHNLNIENESFWTANEMGIRKLKNVILDLLISIKDPLAVNYAMEMIKKSSNMNQQFYALSYLNRYNLEESHEANQIFSDRNKEMTLSMDKWFVAQMGNLLHHNIHDKLVQLMDSNFFDLKIPNKVYALIMSWMNNLASFNDEKNPGYTLMKDLILKIDQFNPQVASRVLKNIKPLNKLPAELSANMKKQLEAIYSNDKISKDSSEIVEKFLKG
jgi:aminopeptidase N